MKPKSFKISPFVSPYRFNAHLIQGIVRILKRYRSKEHSILARDISKQLGVSAKRIADCLQQYVMQRHVDSYRDKVDRVKRYWWAR